MKAVYKIVLLCAAVFAMSLFVTKKSIDYTFKKVECSQTDVNVSENVLDSAKTIEV